MVDWEPLLQSQDIDFVSNYLETELLRITDAMAPFKTFQSRKSTSNWLETETKNLMNERDQQKKLSKDTGTTADWNKFKALRNECVKKVIKDKKQLLQKIVCQIKR